MQQLFKGYYYSKNDVSAAVPEPATNQSSQQILLSGSKPTNTTQATHGEQPVIVNTNSKKRKSRRAEIENEIEEEL